MRGNNSEGVPKPTLADDDVSQAVSERAILDRAHPEEAANTALHRQACCTAHDSGWSASCKRFVTRAHPATHGAVLTNTVQLGQVTKVHEAQAFADCRVGSDCTWARCAPSRGTLLGMLWLNSPGRYNVAVASADSSGNACAATVMEPPVEHDTIQVRCAGLTAFCVCRRTVPSRQENPD